MDELMDGQINEWKKDGWMDGRMDGLIDRWMFDGWTNKMMREWMDGYILLLTPVMIDYYAGVTEGILPLTATLYF